jgi:hypothetical protein
MQTSTAQHDGQRTGELLAGAGVILASWIAVALVSGLIIFGRTRWPVSPSPNPIRLIVLFWAPFTGLFAPLYGFLGYFWARHRVRTQLARGMLVMTVCLFPLGVAGFWWLKVVGHALQGLR